MRINSKKGFSLIEILVVVAIIGVLGSIVAIATSGARVRARDTKRQADLNQFGRFISLSCFVPDSGAGEYDLSELLTELKAKNPQYSAMLGSTPKDPKTGEADDTGYRYIVTADGKKCVFYANLEKEDTKITIESINSPTPGAGTGVFRGSSEGRNGSDIFFQVSN